MTSSFIVTLVCGMLLGAFGLAALSTWVVSQKPRVPCRKCLGKKKIIAESDVPLRAYAHRELMTLLRGLEEVSIGGIKYSLTPEQYVALCPQCGGVGYEKEPTT